MPQRAGRRPRHIDRPSPREGLLREAHAILLINVAPIERGEHRGDGALAERLPAVIRERAIPFDACGDACLCHFDFHSGNVLAER